MELEYRQGNLVDAYINGHVNHIAHCCNCFNTMGGGIAKEIAQRLPEAQKVDSATVSGDSNKLGKLTFAMASIARPTDCVFNLYGQFGYGTEKRQVRYNDLKSALQIARLIIQSLGTEDRTPVLGLPKLGCGLAGGDWEVVERIIKTAFLGSNIKVVIYEL